MVDDAALDVEALALATQLARGATLTYGAMKRLFLSSHDQPLETQMELEARAIAATSRTDDSWNSIQAVRTRNKPVYRGS